MQAYVLSEKRSWDYLGVDWLAQESSLDTSPEGAEVLSQLLLLA